MAAGATGLIRACRDASVKYAKERKTFGVEIGHQLVKEMIAGMESDYQSARLLWLRSGWMKNHGTRNTRETGLAKWFATVASEKAAGDAVQIHGANGYSDEYPVGRFFRNCKGARSSTKARARSTNSCKPTTCSAIGPTVRRGASFRPTRARRRANGFRSRPSFSAWSNRPPSRARTRWGRATVTSPTRSPSRRCAK